MCKVKIALGSLEGVLPTGVRLPLAHPVTVRVYIFIYFIITDYYNESTSNLPIRL